MEYPYDVGRYSLLVTTTSADAQRWFDRGLNWCSAITTRRPLVLREGAGGRSDVRWRIGASATRPGRTTIFPGNWWIRPARPRRWRVLMMRPGGTGAGRLSPRRSGDDPGPAGALSAARADRGPGPGTTRLPSDAHRFIGRIPDDLDFRAIFVEAILNGTPWQMWDAHRQTHAWGRDAGARELLETAFRDSPGRWVIRVCCTCMST